MPTDPAHPGAWPPLRYLAGYLLLLGGAAVLPWLPGAWLAPLSHQAYGAGPAFEAGGAALAVALLVVAGVEGRRRRFVSLADWAPLLAIVGGGLVYLVLLSEAIQPRYDYECYERAAQLVRQGQQPYADAKNVYLYPPLLAEAMATALRLLERLAAGRDAAVWPPRELLFYAFQLAQLASFLLFVATVRWMLAEQGLDRVTSAALAALVCCANVSAIRTLLWSQVNFAIVATILGGVLLGRRWPILAGLLVAYGTHLKLYPALVVLPWLLTQNRRAVLAWAGGVLAVLLIQTDGLRDLSSWTAFAWRQAALNGKVLLPTAEVTVRDNSVANAVRTALVTCGATRWSWPAPVWAVMSLLVRGAVAVWFLVRLRRWLAIRGPARDATVGWELALTAEVAAFAVLLSPLAWEHHYVLAIPLLAELLRRSNGRVAAWAVYALVALVPVTELWPLGMNRCLGLILALWLTPPSASSPGES